MEKEKEEKRSFLNKVPGFRSGKTWKKVVASVGYLFIAFTLLGLVVGEDTSQTTPPSVQEQQVDKAQKNERPAATTSLEENEQPATLSPDPKAILETAVKDKLKDKVREVQVNDYANNPEQKIVLIHFNGGDNLSTSLIRKGMSKDCAEVFEKIYTAGVPVHEATCFVYFPLQDKYGNSSEEVVMKLNLGQETAAKINWEGVSKTEFDNVADSAWLHPALSK